MAVVAMSLPARNFLPEAHRRNLAAIFSMCSKFSLTRGDRMEFAEVLLDRNVNSYNDLSPAELQRVRDGLEGAALVCLFQIQRRRGERQ